jgi:hypothetical protein
LHQVGDLFELNVKLRCQKVKCNAVRQHFMHCSFYGIQYKKNGTTTNRRRKQHYGGERLPHCLPPGRHYGRRWQRTIFMLAEYRRTLGINFKYIEKKNPSITNHRFLLLVHVGYYTHPLLVLWSRKCRAIALLCLWAVRPVQSLSTRTRVHFTWGLLQYFSIQLCPIHNSNNTKNSGKTYMQNY